MTARPTAAAIAAALKAARAVDPSATVEVEVAGVKVRVIPGQPQPQDQFDMIDMRAK